MFEKKLNLFTFLNFITLLMENKRKKTDSIDEDNTDPFIKDLEEIFNKKNIIDSSDLSCNEILYSLINNIQNETSTYLNYHEIIKDFKQLIIKHQEGMMNRCVQCGTDMGITNPRQLCGKTYCFN